MQEPTSGRRFLFGLLFGHEIAVNANHIGCHNWWRRSDYTQYTVRQKSSTFFFSLFLVCVCVSVSSTTRVHTFNLSILYFFHLIWFNNNPNQLGSIYRFIQSWSVRNNGEEVWPYGCYIKSTSNENLPVVPVEPIEPGQCTVISVNLRSPCELGSFQTKWRLFTSNGSCFGGKWNLNYFSRLLSWFQSNDFGSIDCSINFAWHWWNTKKFAEIDTTGVTQLFVLL